MHRAAIFYFSLFYSMYVPSYIQAQEHWPEAFDTFLQAYAERFEELTYTLHQRGSSSGLYENDIWQTSALMDLEGRMLAFTGRYNILLSAMEILINGEIRAINPRKIQAVRIGNHIYSIQQFLLPNGHERKVYFQHLSEGFPQLLKLYYIDSQIQGGNSLSAHLTGERKAFIETAYYYRIPNEKLLKELPKSRRSLVDIFGPSKDKAESWIDNHEFRLRNENQLVALFEHMASIRSDMD